MHHVVQASTVHRSLPFIKAENNQLITPYITVSPLVVKICAVLTNLQSTQVIKVII